MRRHQHFPPSQQASHQCSLSAPVIILTRPQLAENIGAAARAMLNCGLHEMRLVAPQQDWPHQRAVATAAGADSVLNQAKLFSNLGTAIADLQFVIAATARRRDLSLPTLTPRIAATKLRLNATQGIRQGVIFGPERSGLDNEDLIHAEAILYMPLNPFFLSLNLAQAILLLGYEWYLSDPKQANITSKREDREPIINQSQPAVRADLEALFTYVEMMLDKVDFFRPAEKRPRMRRNLRALFLRARLSEQEIRSLRGVTKALMRAGYQTRP